jgi:hypothetical protein
MCPIDVLLLGRWGQWVLELSENSYGNKRVGEFEKPRNNLDTRDVSFQLY